MYIKERLILNFLEIDPRYSIEIFNFLINSCKTLPKRIPLIVQDKNKGNDDLGKKQKEILEKLCLKDLRDGFKFKVCLNCNLCTRSIFEEKRRQFLKIKDKLFSENTTGGKKLEILSDIYNRINGTKSNVVKTFDDRFYILFDTLLEEIETYFFYYILEKINKFKSSDSKSNVYFDQISKLLPVTREFISDIKKLRGKYMEEIESKGKVEYVLTVGPQKNKAKYKNYQKGLDSLMKNYKLATRWRSYIENGVLKFLSNDQGELISPYKEINPMPPDGSPGINYTITKDRVYISDLLLVGDEPEKEVKEYCEKYNIKNIEFEKLKLRRRPIKNFNVFFRWYKSYQDIEESNKKYSDVDSDVKNIYSYIFYDDIECARDKDWPPGYHVFFNKVRQDKSTPEEALVFEKKGELRIRKAINLLKGIIFNKLK